MARNRVETPLISIIVVATIGAGACAPPARPGAPAPQPAVPDDWPLIGETEAVFSQHAMTSSVHPIASEVGVSILRKGGNAVDAAVAMGMALAVVHPAAGNIGGGGFMVIRLADGTVRTIDYREAAPAAATEDMYLDKDGRLTRRSITGHLSVGVPGSVAGMAEVHRELGRLPWAEVLAPAVKLAREGFPLDEHRSRSLGYAARRLRQFEASRRQYLRPNGKAPPKGAVLRQPDLARTLQAISDSGPRVFYEGFIADLLVTEMRRGGGLVTKADLANYRPFWREPIVIRYRGYTIYSMPPASSGGVTMGEILNILESAGPLPGYGTPEHIHLLAEAMRRGFIDRNRFLGDPDFVEMPLDRLLSKEYAASLLETIDRERATPTSALSSAIAEGDHTTHYSVVDAEGNAVSVTTTINLGYGSGVTVAGAGFLLNDEMDDFAAAPGQPNAFGLIQGRANAIAGGKRMLSSMTPTIVLDPRGELLMVLGSPGGSTIITTVTQVISNVIDHGMSLPEAIAAPRVHHQALPDQIFYERGGLRPEVVDRLRAMGHIVRERTGFSGDVSGIMRTATGWVGVADPRSGGAARGY